MTEDGNRLLEVLGPNEQSHALHAEMRTHAASVVCLDERINVGRFQGTLREFGIHHIGERAEDDEVVCLQWNLPL